MPRRRLSGGLAAGVLALFALLALAGCRVEPGNAAFVGDTVHSKADVDRVVQQIEDDGIRIDPTRKGALRQLIAQDQVFVDIAHRYATEKGYGEPSLDLATAAQELSPLPPTNVLVHLAAQTNAYRELLLSKAKPVPLSDADLREVYQNLVDSGARGTFEEIAPLLRQVPSIGPAIAVRNELAEAVHRYGVQVNPRYGPPSFPLLELTDQSTGRKYPAVVLSYSGSSAKPVVRNVS